MTSSSTPTTYVLDTSVFTQAHRIYYPHEICPGFWDCLLHHCGTQQLVSIDRVHDEITAGTGEDDVKRWAKVAMKQSFFAKTSTPAVVAQFAQMMQWAQDQMQFKPEAKAEFARVADGWVAAYAKVNGLTLVTQEEYAPDVRRRVPLPNVCKAFNVECITTFDLLRSLKARFGWTPVT